MKATIQKNILKPLLSDLVTLTGRKTNLAITENVLIQAKKGPNFEAVTISATDLETGFIGTYPAQVETPGTIVVSGKRLLDIVRDWPAQEVTIDEVENRWVKIATHKITYEMVGMNPDDFPGVPDVYGFEFFEVPAAALANAVHRAVMIDPGEDTRAHVAGVHLVHRPVDRVLRLKSTDGSRINIMDVGYEEAGGLDHSVLIPKFGLAAAKKFISRSETVRIGVSEGQFAIQSAIQEEASMFIRLLEGDYPDISGILARRGKGFEAGIDRGNLTAMLKRMSVFVTPNYSAVTLCFEENRLSVRVVNPDVGESSEEMEIAYSGDPIEVYCNGKYLMDAVSAIGWGDSVKFELSDATGPLFVSGADKHFIAAVMPMRP